MDLPTICSAYFSMRFASVLVVVLHLMDLLGDWTCVTSQRGGILVGAMMTVRRWFDNSQNMHHIEHMCTKSMYSAALLKIQKP